MVGFSADCLLRTRQEIFRIKVGADGLGWSPRLRQRFGYFTPDEWYESIMYCVIKGDTAWLDVGCGRDLFPYNQTLGAILSSRCKLLVGIDPDENINGNTLLHERQQCSLEEYVTDRQFDVISLRMVVEHIANPESAVSSLYRLVRPGGRVVVYTVTKWSPVSLVARLTPFHAHREIKRIMWGAADEDSFPTRYKMNTRRKLRALFCESGFVEEAFYYLNDCQSFSRWRVAAFSELILERQLRRLGIRYPEICLLGLYRKSGDLQREV